MADEKLFYFRRLYHRLLQQVELHKSMRKWEADLLDQLHVRAYPDYYERDKAA